MLLKGAAWSAPVFTTVTAAPALAVSSACVETDVQLNWGLATYSGVPEVAAPFTTSIGFDPQVQGQVFPGLDSPLTATVRHTWSGSAQRPSSNDLNGRISSFNVGGIGQVGYGLYQQTGPNGRNQPTNNDYQTIQFTFSEALTNLRFSITDIDRAWGEGIFATRDFIDGVSLTSPSAFTALAPVGSSVIGSGTVSSPWQNSQNQNHSEDGPGGQIDIVFTEPVTTFTLRYSNLGRGTIRPGGVNNDQAIFVTGFTTNRPQACVS